MNTVFIKNGQIIDGTGKEPYTKDIIIENDKISSIIDCGTDVKAETVIDADNCYVTPGFIDIHRHCDIKPFNDPYFGDVLLAQGITTTIVGNCGISMTPVCKNEKQAAETYDFDEPVLGPPFSSIKTYRDYVKAIESIDLPINIGAMIGTGNVKIAIKGFSNTPFNKDEMQEAQQLIEEALSLGAPGISSGIMYLPECYSSTDEFAELLKPLGKYNRVLCTHIRGEGDSLVESIKEVIEIAKKANCALEISHFKSCGIKNWRKEIYKAITIIEQERSLGMDITCDFYPYEGGSTALTTMLPPAFVQGDMNNALKKLGTKEGIEEFRQSVSKLYDSWDNYAISLGWNRILISGVDLKENEKFLGMDVKTAAKQFGFRDSVELAAYLMHSENGKTAIINMSMCQDDIDTIAKLPYSIVISDSIYADTHTPHPRMYGAFPKIIREYVLDRNVLSLEEAVKKMTKLPAERMGIAKRGVIQEGNFADILIFDKNKFKDNATFQNPAQLATGLGYALINGKIAYKDDKVMARNTGTFIKR